MLFIAAKEVFRRSEETNPGSMFHIKANASAPVASGKWPLVGFDATAINQGTIMDPLESEDSAGFADAILPVSVSSDFMFLLKCLAVAVPAAYLLAWMFNPAWGMI